MIITEHDKPLTAEDARKISINNRDDSLDRTRFRELMGSIKEYASYGYTRHITTPKIRDLHPGEQVQNVLRSFGYRVIEKRAYEWDSEKKEYSDRPLLSHDKREQFFLEITWG
jgi:hypothetical protein